MTLEESILMYEAERLIAIVNSSPILKNSSALSDGRDLKGDLAIYKILLEAASSFDNVKEEDLDCILDKLNHVTKQIGLVHKGHNVRAALKEYIKVKIEFYQRLLKHKEEIDNFKDAVKREFCNELGYRKALQPIEEADARYREIMSEQLKHFIPEEFRNEVVTVHNYIRETIKTVDERIITYLFNT